MIDWTKPVQTRDGREARVLCTNLKNKHFPVAIAVIYEGEEILKNYTLAGKYYLHSGYEDEANLMNIPEEITVWVNFYRKHLSCCAHETRSEADMAANKRQRIACGKVTVKEGDGL